MGTARFLALVLFLSISSAASAYIDTSRTSVLENPLARPDVHVYVCLVGGYFSNDSEKELQYFSMPVYGISRTNAEVLQGEIIDYVVQRTAQKRPLFETKEVACGFPGDNNSWFEAIIES